jgi:NACHT domain
MLRQRSVLLLILLLSSALLAALANILGNLAADQVPLYLKANALQLFASAILVEFGVGVVLERVQKGERRPTRLALIYLLIAVGAGAATLGGVVSNIVAAALPQSIRPYLESNVVLLLVAVTILTILVEVVAYSLSAVVRPTPHNRMAFLSKVHERYTTRRRDTLGEAAQIDLHLREDARAITQPALARHELGDRHKGQQTEQILPTGKPISSVYDEAQEELLILGRPGAGKTTLLVELALELVLRTEKSKQLKIPVIFSLASWVVKRLPLAQWMAQELHETYQVPKKVAATWAVEADEILPLLDGLDEVTEKHREACARAIEDYHQEHPLVPLVVCSRRAEYFALPTRLQLRTAVVVKPLTARQITDYLTQGTGLAGLRAALAADRRLCSAARTPLMLAVMALTYQDMEGAASPHVGDVAAWRRRLFDDYVSRMYHRQRGTSELREREGQTGPKRVQEQGSKPAQPTYSLEQTIHYLTWLAVQMKAHGQPDFFYLERTQWDWLSNERVDRPRRPRLIEPT